MTTRTTSKLRATNYSQESENRIHSDEIAQQLGFTGALVPGVAVFGYMATALANEAFLNSSRFEVRFLKPAYDGDLLSLRSQETGWQAHNEEGTLLAVLRWLDAAPTIKPELFSKAPKTAPRVPINWDAIQPEEPWPAWRWQVNADDNRVYAFQVSDEHPRYERYLHPHWLLSTCNTVLTRQFEMNAWIHVGSEVHQHHAVLVGDTIEVQGVPLERWQKKGHEFVRAHVRFQRQGETVADVLHTAIFRIAGT